MRTMHHYDITHCNTLTSWISIMIFDCSPLIDSNDEDRACMRMRMMHPDRHTWGRSPGGCRSIWDQIQTGNDRTNDARGADIMLGDNRCSRGIYCSLSMFYV